MVPENIPPQDRLTEIQSGSGGLQKPKFLQEKYEAEPKFSGGEGFNLKRTFCGTGMDISGTMLCIKLILQYKSALFVQS